MSPDINSKMNNLNRTYEERLYYFQQFMDKIGAASLDPFKKYVKYANQASQANGFDDRGEEWRLTDFESEDFPEMCDKIWDQIKPLFQQLHAFIRRKLREKHPDYITKDGPIPAHLLGSMWSVLI